MCHSVGFIADGLYTIAKMPAIKKGNADIIAIRKLVENGMTHSDSIIRRIPATICLEGNISISRPCMIAKKQTNIRSGYGGVL